MSEEKLQRLKQLSAAQTLFLKAYLNKKIGGVSSVIEDTLNLLESKGVPDQQKVFSIRSNLAALKLGELEADSSKAEAIVRDELAILRTSIESGGLPTPPPPAGGGSTADLAKMTALQNENAELRKLLKDVKEELTASASAGADSAEIVTLRSKVQSLESALAGKEKELAAVRDASSSGESNAVAAVQEDLAKARAELADTKSRLAAEKESSAAEVMRLEALLVSEKEELMDAMAQEVEAVEKSKAEELAVLGARCEKLQSEGTASSARLAASLKAARGAAAGLVVLHKSVRDKTHKELASMRVDLLNGFKGEFANKLRNANNDYLVLKERYLKEIGERRRLHNIVSELKGNIRVFMRCRPPTKKELDQFGSDATCVTFSDLVPNEVRVFNSEKGRDKTWEFDEVFSFGAAQEQVYAEVSPLVTSVLDGYNVCIFAYGQTGSGKTFTMSGPADEPGVNTRALEDLFGRIAERSGEYKDSVTVSLLEVYNEEIRDLLVDAKSAGKLEVKQGEFGNYVPGLTCVPVSNLEEVTELFRVGDKNRSQAQTNMNEHSSRSHMMLTVTLSSTSVSQGVVSRGKLNLVDLAGSERIDKSGATGQALKEAQNINQSLSALGDVIAARGNKQAHIPFRNSTLTYLLQDSLSKDSKTLMFVCASPVSYNAEETFCSLNFAARVRAVELGKAAKNSTVAAASGRQSVPNIPAGKRGLGK